MDQISALKNRLAQLEARLQAIIEGSAARLFSPDGQKGELAHRLITAMQAGIKPDSGGRLVAPNEFTLVVHPVRRVALQGDQALFEALTRSIEAAGNEMGLIFLAPPRIVVDVDSESVPGEVQVQAAIRIEGLSQTTGMEPVITLETMAVDTSAFLIVNGTQIYPLTQPVVNIGRRPDNHLVIDDPRVSRLHAQLRDVKGRYVLFDLDSTGGTFVNDQRIHQCVLYPGDVISIAGVPLVFGQEAAATSDTQKFNP
jgi:FHA domain/FhaA, N-terminal domain